MFLKDHNKTAFIYEDRPVSYREMIGRAGAYAGLYELSPGDRVGLLSENRPEWIYAFYSTWHKGGISVPMDITAKPEEIAYVINDCMPRVVFCSREGEKLIQNARPLLINTPDLMVFEDIPFPLEEKELRIEPVHMHDTAVIMYTSGTTGRSKGVMLSYDNLLASIEGIVDLGMMTKDDIIVGLLPFFHITPFQGTVLLPFFVGATVAYVKNLTSDEILSTLQKHRVTMFLGVPRLYELFHGSIMNKINASIAAKILFRIARTLKNRKLGRVVFGKVHRAFGGYVHAFLSGGARLDEKIAWDLWSLGFRMVEGYGLTETAPLVAFNPYRKIKLGTVGQPLSGTRVEVRDGEIVVQGRNVMKGYYNKPDETSRVLRDGWLHTGDTGYFDSEGYLSITGRVDEMIVLSSGKNINPEEIERKLLTLSPFIRDAGVAHRDGYLTAFILPDFVTLKNNGIINIQETLKWKVLDRYNAGAPPHQRITRFNVVREDLPRTRLGKLRRFMMVKSAGEEKTTVRNPAVPQSAEYRSLKEFLGLLTGREVMPGDHLELDLGLDSLNKVELMVFLETSFGTPINEQILAACPTVNDLAEYLSREKTITHREDINWKKILGERTPFTLPETGLRVRFLQALSRPLMRAYFSITHEGLENLPESPFILAPNHQSFMDSLLLSIILPKQVLNQTFFLARESLLNSKIIRYLSKNANVIFINIEKDLKGALQKSAAVLQKGRNLVIFPEGHRSRDGELGMFKKTFAILSKEMNIPVVPLAIDGAFNLYSVGKLVPVPGRVKFTFCKPIYPDRGDYQALADGVRQIIKDILESRDKGSCK